jgi:hypothetical protein
VELENVLYLIVGGVVSVAQGAIFFILKSMNSRITDMCTRNEKEHHEIKIDNSRAHEEIWD